MSGLHLVANDQQPDPSAPANVDAYLVMWRCGCSDVRVRPADVPILCPGHGSVQLAQPELIKDALVRYVGVHECPDSRKCEGAA